MAVCHVCGGKGASEKTFTTKKHINSKKHQKALGNNGQKTTIAKPTGSSNMDSRISALERQIAEILKRLDQIERSLGVKNMHSSTPKDKSEIKTLLLSKIPVGRSITSDNLHKALEKYQWGLIDQVVKELVDEEIFDIAEGKSNKKFLGRYGLLIRR